VIACGDVVRAKKPAPDVYLHALAVLGVSADEAVAFEDSAHGLSAAKGAGLRTVVTPTPWTQDQDLRAADLNLPDLTGLTLDALESLLRPAPKSDAVTEVRRTW
jgi:beta-phosphoglucomutase-like phosphatase (HAD superfamily)